MKNPAVKAKPAARPAGRKTAGTGQTVPAVEQLPVAKIPASREIGKPAATARNKTTSVDTSVSKPASTGAALTKPAGPKAGLSVPPTSMKKTAVADSVAPMTSKTAAPTAAPTPGRVPRVSRLSQLTVPSMAQSVASTAAKNSFTQPSTPVFAPAPHVALKKDPKLANNWKTKTAAELVDAEVIAMADADYMNDKQMAFFRLKLVELKRGILENAGETTEHLREDTVVVPDPADRATIEEEHALELRTRDRERKLLKKIEQSIQRIDAGDYGYCDETGEPIGVGRLLARPTATLSLEAQQRRELKQKMFGD